MSTELNIFNQKHLKIIDSILFVEQTMMIKLASTIILLHNKTLFSYHKLSCHLVIMFCKQIIQNKQKITCPYYWAINISPLLLLGLLQSLSFIIYLDLFKNNINLGTRLKGKAPKKNLHKGDSESLDLCSFWQRYNFFSRCQTNIFEV